MTEEQLIISLIKQVRDDVTGLSKSVGRNNSKVVSNGVKLDIMINYSEKCDERLTDLEDWKAGHVGFAAGKSRKASLFGSNTTLICTVGATLIALAGLWFTTIAPALSVSARVLDRVEIIEEKYQVASDVLESLKALKK